MKTSNPIQPNPDTNIENSSSSRFCEVCCIKFTTEAKLIAHLAQKDHKRRATEEAYCHKQAMALQINFKNYEISQIDQKDPEYYYECKRCDKKFVKKIELINHIKSAIHNPMAKRSFKQQNHQIRQKFPRFRDSYNISKRPLQSQLMQSNQTFNQSTSTNIFGAFDPDNQYSNLFQIQLMKNSNSLDEPNTKRIRTTHDQDNNHDYSYSSYGNSYPQANIQYHSSESISFNDQGTLSRPPVQYPYNYYDQQSSTSNYLTLHSQNYHAEYFASTVITNNQESYHNYTQ
ncbi:hypothetical protein I4U23_019333 [Adineta vaga]|nr:hypothetical protein I4U23_019333 [Adineta vaga]